MKNLLVIGSVWPEPSSSAAGRRMLQIISIFQKSEWSITFASHAGPSENTIDFKAQKIIKKEIKLNCESFDRYIAELQPEAVIYDRFMTEEQYSWRVMEQCPNAVQLLDTEDLHCLRYARHEAVKQNRVFNKSDLVESESAIRESSSILRCDLSIMISEYEIDILKSTLNIPKHIINYLPFLHDGNDEDSLSFEERYDFVSIGNFMHAPNWDAVLYLKEKIWPSIHKVLPDTKLHIYGSYTPQKAFQLHNEKEGFLVHGKVKCAKEVISKSRVLLAPLRFGAGLKGKLFEAMEYGTPSVTSSIGAEGMKGEFNWPGNISNDPNNFAKFAIELYTNKDLWNTASTQGKVVLQKRFSKTIYEKLFWDQFLQISENLAKHRSKNFFGKILNYNSHRSTKFMSRWIEAKNQLKRK